jgi:hypothetical protein
LLEPFQQLCLEAKELENKERENAPNTPEEMESRRKYIEQKRASFFISLEPLVKQINSANITNSQAKAFEEIKKRACAINKNVSYTHLFCSTSKYELPSITLSKIVNLIKNYFQEHSDEILTLQHMVEICSRQTPLSHEVIRRLAMHPHIVDIGFSDYEHLLGIGLSKGYWSLVQLLGTAEFSETFVKITYDYIMARAQGILHYHSFVKAETQLFADKLRELFPTQDFFRKCFNKAIRQGDLEIALILNDHFGITDCEMSHALFYAVESGRFAIVEYVCRRLNIDNVDKYTLPLNPLHWAIEKGYAHITKYLLSKKTDLTDCCWLLSKGIASGNLETVKEIITEVHKTTGFLSAQHLLLAIQKGTLDIAKYLVELGMKIPADQHNAVLSRAAQSGKMEIFKYVLHELNIPLELNSVDLADLLVDAAASGSLDLFLYLESEFSLVKEHAPEMYHLYSAAATSGCLPLLEHLFSKNNIPLSPCNLKAIASTCGSMVGRDGSCAWAYLWYRLQQDYLKTSFKQIAYGHIDALSESTLKEIWQTISKSVPGTMDRYGLRKFLYAAIRKTSLKKHIFKHMHGGNLPQEIINAILAWVDFSERLPLKDKRLRNDNIVEF